MRLFAMRIRRGLAEARRNGRASSTLSEMLYQTRGPAEAVLTASLRRLARAKPDAFDRLGPVRKGAVRVAPTDLPIAFDILPNGTAGSVRVVRPAAPVPADTARISGPLKTLLAIFDGGGDADSAFFQRQIQVEGDTAAVLALHNALEACEVTLADLIGVPTRLRPLAERLGKFFLRGDRP
jgi:predicted lipid carrier protein YhbT